jgi:hypothetical protein
MNTVDDAMILRGILLPPLLIQGSDGGGESRALGETHYKFFWDGSGVRTKTWVYYLMCPTICPHPRPIKSVKLIYAHLQTSI